MASRIVAEVEMQTAGVTRGVNAVSSKLGGLRRATTSTGNVMKGVLGANIIGKAAELGGRGLSALTDKVGEVRTAGSDLQQSTGAVDAVFGKYSAGIKKSAAQAEQSLGLSKNAYQELTTSLGAGLKNQGIKDFATQTQNVTKLGADLSAQFGGSTSEAVQAIGSLMRGEADPIEKYGVSIKESAISAELAAKGQSKLTGAALDQAKAQARLSLLFQQTKDAQGAFAREGESLANVQQRNAAAAENLKAKLGTSLLPVFTAGANLISTKVLPVADKLVTWASANLPGALATAKAALTPVFAVLAGLGPVVLPILQQIGAHFLAVGAAVSQAFAGGGGIAGFVAQLRPLGQIVAGTFGQVSAVVRTVLPIVIGVVSQIVAAFRQNLPAIQSAVSAVTSTLSSIASIITSVWAKIGPIVLPIVKAVFGTVIGVISGAFSIIAGIFKVISSVLKGDWGGAWNGIKQIVSGNVKIVTSIVKGLASILGTLWGAVKGVALAAWSGIKAGVSSLVGKMATAVRVTLNALKAANAAVWSAIYSATIGKIVALASGIVARVSAIRSSISSAWSAVRAATSAAWSAIYSATIGKIVALASTGAARINAFRASVSNAWNALKAATSAAFSSLLSTAKARLDSAVATVRGLPGRIRGALGNLGSLLYSAGSDVVQGFINGITGAIAGAAAAAANLGRAAIDAAKAALDENSPSKEFILIGKYVSQGLAAGIVGGGSKVTAEVRGIAWSIGRAFVARFNQAQRAYTTNEGILRHVTSQVTAARSQLSELVKSRVAYASSVTSAARSFAAITSITAADDQELTAGTIIQGLADRLAAVREFTANLGRLRDRGINQVTLDQLVAGGVETGGAAAAALAAGGREAVAAVNTTQAALDVATARLGGNMANAMFRTGVDAQKGLLAGLVANQRELEKSAAAIAATLTASIRKALGIKSPSRVFREVGENVTDGLLLGLGDRQVAGSGAALADALKRGFGAPALTVGGGVAADGAGGRGGNTYMIRVEPTATASPADIGRAVVESIKAFERQTSQRVLTR